METKQQLSFLQEKIVQIGTALFFSLSDAVLRLPACVVSNLKVDEYGYVWFRVQKPNEELQAFETAFPVRLNLFRKGLNFYMQIEGNGWAVTDPEEIFTLGRITEELIEPERSDTVLVKVKIFKAAYYKSRSTEKLPMWKSSLQLLYSWLGTHHQYKAKNTFLLPA